MYTDVTLSLVDSCFSVALSFFTTVISGKRVGYGEPEYVTDVTTHCEAEVQTEITQCSRVIFAVAGKKFKNKECNTPHIDTFDQSVQTDFPQVEAFQGFSSARNDQQLQDLAGVTFNNFKFLLKRTFDASRSCKMSKENRLFIFLIKVKTGLTFSAIAVLFSVHRTTISRIFFSILQTLAFVTSNLVLWLNKDIIQGTMPECFKEDYNIYSHYKKGFTAKLLVGITPAGFISLKSRVAGGRKSDSLLTIESGLIDLLDDGDIVLADKGFPEIKETVNESGKKVLVIMSPFLEKKSEFNKQETEETYCIARVRIHVERVMQRLRTYNILNKIPANLFHCLDDIVHVCCVLVNLQPPIINDEKDIVEKSSN